MSVSFHSHGIRRQWESVAANTICVSAGFKGAYLFDQGRADAETILAFLRTAKQAGLITHLDILDIDHDSLFITRRQTLMTQCVCDQRDCFRRISFIDVSPHREHPCFVSDGERRMIIQQLGVLTDNLLSALSSESYILPKTIAVKSHPDLPLCVLFGYLLGYPIIYWTDNVDPCASNCLGMVSLRRHTAVMSSRELREQIVSSFSLPENLCVGVECHVAKWKEQFAVDCLDAKCGDFSFTFSEQSFVFPQVAL